MSPRLLPRLWSGPGTGPPGEAAQADYEMLRSCALGGRLPAGLAAARFARRGLGHRIKPDVRTQLNRRSIVTTNGKITNLGWCQGSSEADPSRIK